MRITPLDIRKQEFKKAMRGLDPDEVHAFLATVADEYESALTDNKQLREKVIQLEGKVSEFRTLEETLRNTLVTAERAMNEARENSRKEAELILREASSQAQMQTASVAGKVESIKIELVQLQAQRNRYLARMNALAESQVALVREFASDSSQDDVEAGLDPYSLDGWKDYDLQTEAAATLVSAPVDTGVDELEGHETVEEVARAVEAAHVVEPTGQAEPAVAASAPAGLETNPPEIAGAAAGEGAAWSLNKFEKGISEI